MRKSEVTTEKKHLELPDAIRGETILTCVTLHSTIILPLSLRQSRFPYMLQSQE